MISSTDRCRQLVAGNYDVILNEPSSFKQVLMNFLDRFEHHENELADDRGGGAGAGTGGYVNEFKMLKELSRVLKENTDSFKDGLAHYNQPKNRYKDIIPFNQTRVILSCNPYETLDYADQVGGDYINANYIAGPSGFPKTYIASQGPLPNTVNDFWRMIWECNVSVIVMACNEQELGKAKCELYWPDQTNGSQEFGNIKVTLKRVRQVNSDFLIRKFSIKFLEPHLEFMNHLHPLVQTDGQQLRHQSPISNDGNNNDMMTTTSTAITTSTTLQNGNHPYHNINSNINNNNNNITCGLSNGGTSSTSNESINTSDDSTNTTSNHHTNHDRYQQQQHQRQQNRNSSNSRAVLMEKSVVQFHVSSWPDHGVPDSVQPILELVRLIREVQPFEHTPILVHCSAGCGRTGTICCIDYVYGLMRMGKLDSSFDLFSIISEMRQQRMAMVQTLEQYILCHRAVASLFIEQLQLLGHHHHLNRPHHHLHDQHDDEEPAEDDDDNDNEDEDEDEQEDLGPVFI